MLLFHFRSEETEAQKDTATPLKWSQYTNLEQSNDKARALSVVSVGPVFFENRQETENALAVPGPSTLAWREPAGNWTLGRLSLLV